MELCSYFRISTLVPVGYERFPRGVNVSRRRRTEKLGAKTEIVRSIHRSSLFNVQFFAIGNKKGNIGNKKTAKLLGAKNVDELIQIKCTTAGNQSLVVVVVVFLFLFWPKRILLSLSLFAGVVLPIQACTSYYIASRDF